MSIPLLCGLDAGGTSCRAIVVSPTAVRGAGCDVIDWAWGETKARRELVNRFQEISRGDGWLEERTGLHESQSIETLRHWFTFCAHLTSGSGPRSILGHSGRSGF